jgi:hypothetical protein
VNGFDLEAGMTDSGTLGQQLQQAERVFSTRKPYQHTVIVVKQVVSRKGVYKPLVQFLE